MSGGVGFVVRVRRNQCHRVSVLKQLYAMAEVIRVVFSTIPT